MSNLYTQAYDQSINDPEGFWGNTAQDCHWYKKWDKVLDDSNTPFYRWFTGAQTNTCYNAVDLHVENGFGDRDAIIYDSPVTSTIRKYTFSQLKEQVSTFAGVLVSKGVLKGDRVIIYMPMIPEAVFAMLACARIGAIHSVVFGGFAANELATRINDAKPKVIVSASCGIEVTKIIEYKPLLDEAISLSDAKPDACIIFQRPQARAQLIQGRDYDWDLEMSDAVPQDCVPVMATDPLYILYTSGTTGQPKGVVRDNGGHMVALKWTMEAIYGVKAGQVYWAASDIGWVVGHSYIVYGPLLKGCTTVLFEGKPVGTPDASVFWRIISQHRVKTLFTAPTAFRAIKREDPKATLMKNFDLSGFEYLFLAGERLDPDTLSWAQNSLNVPVIDHWWQTETGWAIAANCMGLHHFKVKPGSPTKPAPGWDMAVLGDDGKPVKPGDIGALVARLPLPPGTLPTLWQNDQRYQDSYLKTFPGYYETADAGYIDEDGYVFVMARTDDIINVAGHRLSTGAMEEVIASHPDVAECAVMGVEDTLKGQIPLGMMVLNAGVDRDENEITKEVIELVRKKIGPVAAFKTATVVKRLPKTRSGKILRGTMRAIADKKTYKVPATIDDYTTLDEIEESLGKIGYGKKA
ncbi:MAG: propionyl-CoA synthetase [Proteobacteria bacterium]|nr:propionyl-CoA synthetase [Pseudomonadota bacterium]MBU1387034.1 propionyl-CoA synthetase [Pseudomonadota bacterium]MBU1542285.1 propionyl-CoA synthetase [Pseudomonadota bacterium]MBU2431449.1 propionyl-CoA synthetase [Pseudomonadota bacterium]MBU2479800.1 propionyl-CoA synthetase [Pseudomonadota bacterium]